MISSLITSMGGESGATSWTRRVLELLPMESRYSLARTCKWMFNCAVESGLETFTSIALGEALATMPLEMVQFMYTERLLTMSNMSYRVEPEFMHSCFKAGLWVVDTLLESESNVFEWAVRNNCVQLIQYGFEHNWDNGFKVGDIDLMTLDTLELLYTRKHLWSEFLLSEMTSMHENTFVFLLMHQLDSMFDLDVAFQSIEFLCVVLVDLCHVQNVMIVRRIIDIWLCSTEGVINISAEVCDELEPRIRREISCDYCECADPNRHERLRTRRNTKRRKL
jgi:hypothetical protein